MQDSIRLFSNYLSKFGPLLPGRIRHLISREISRLLIVSFFATPICTAQTAAQQAETEPKQPRIGLALGGGGTRGCAHIGVLRVLEREKIPVACISGTSIGAIVGGLYAAGVCPDDIQKMICSKKLLHAYDTVPIPLRIAVIPFFYISHLFGGRPYDGLYRGNKFANYLTKSVPEAAKNIENSEIPFSAVASNLLDGKAYAITSGNIGRAIQASSALPGLRRPLEWQGKLFIDGGMIVNLPCQQTRDLGADYVIAVNVDDDLHTLPTDHFRKTGSVTARAINMHLSAIDAFQLDKADIVIHPDVTGIRLLSRKVKDVDIAVKAGECAAENALPSIRRLLSERQLKEVPAKDGRLSQDSLLKHCDLQTERKELND
ncbi:MAG: patatin-like phospholipase family protein [Candidatus Obscuribacterales bacterium]|nr:patatin-like phospholipase family protein [Candidatus Obscuribacterales bacterium]